ncbi:hypothetical protein D3C73_1386270 [compost metagenome]
MYRGLHRYSRILKFECVRFFDRTRQMVRLMNALIPAGTLIHRRVSNGFSVMGMTRLRHSLQRMP